MERLIDKGIIAICCLTAFLTLPINEFTFGGLLVALAIAAFGEALPRVGRVIAALAYFIAALVFPELAAFLPLIVYDCMRDELIFVRFSWLVPLVAAMRMWEALPWALVALFCIVSAVLSRKTASLAEEREHFRKLRDDAHEASLSLEERNRNLQEAKELSAQVATLAERGRIAREIHDNVGHLLTRAIMQVEALKVVHANEPAIANEYDSVATTLNEAMQTVRASVHDLRDEATDARELIKSALDGSGVEHTKLIYEAESLPADVARCFVAITREAATNTVRHSDATSIEVQVHEYPGLYQLIVQDNGSGKKDDTSTGSGMGLQAMDDRVRALGGTLRTSQEKGFRILASIPKSEHTKEGA